MSDKQNRLRPLSEMSRDDLEAHAERLREAVERLAVYVPKPFEPLDVNRDTAIRAVRHLLIRLIPGVDVDFSARSGQPSVEEVCVYHDDPEVREQLTEIATSVLAQVGYPVEKGDGPRSGLISLREQARQRWLDESAEALSLERDRDIFRRLRGPMDPYT